MVLLGRAQVDSYRKSFGRTPKGVRVRRLTAPSLGFVLLAITVAALVLASTLGGASGAAISIPNADFISGTSNWTPVSDVAPHATTFNFVTDTAGDPAPSVQLEILDNPLQGATAFVSSACLPANANMGYTARSLKIPA